MEEERRRKHGQPQRYHKGRFLGKGGFAKCYEVKNVETKEVFAAKVVSKASVVKPKAMAKLKSEIAIHESLDHDKVVKFIEYFEDQDSVYMILELCPNQTLADFVRKRPSKRLSEHEAVFYAHDLVHALKYLHNRLVIHRDLKLGNLFLDAEYRLKVGDFGLSAVLEKPTSRRRTICGTPNYIAPEILDGKSGHGFETDIWSFGVIVYTVLVGHPPFESKDVNSTYHRIRQNDYSFQDSPHVSQDAVNLISMILLTDPALRLKLDRILLTPWMQGYGAPPPPPSSLCLHTSSTSPRMPMAGVCSVRSDTPECRTGEWATADFARIDSPQPSGRFPLRERSPSLSAAQAHSQRRGQSATPPSLPLGKLVTQPSYSGAMTPGRYGRPPFVSDENMAPSRNDNVRKVFFPVTLPPSSPAPHRAPRAHDLDNIGTGRCGVRVPGNSMPQPNPDFRGGDSRRLNTGGWSSLRPSGRSPRQPGGSATVPSACRLPPSGPAATRDALLRTSTPARVPLAELAHGTVGCKNQIEQPGLVSGRVFHGRCHQQHGQASEGCRPEPESNNRGTPRRALARPVQSTTRANERSSSTPALLQEFNGVRPRSPAQRRHGATAAQEVKDDVGDSCGSTKLLSSLATLSSLGMGSNSRSGSSGASGPSGRRSPASTPPVAALHASAKLPDIWVTRWFDISSKYGVAYTLSDGAIGAFFNDSTKIVLYPEGSQFDYHSAKGADRLSVRTSGSLHDYPEELKKKVTLLKYFRDVFVNFDKAKEQDQATRGASSLNAVRPLVQPPQRLRFVARCLTANSPQLAQINAQVAEADRSILMFQLSNNSVHAVFNDGTELVVFNSEGQCIVARSHQPTGYVCSCPLAGVMNLLPVPGLARKVKFIREVAASLWCLRLGD